MRIGICDDEIVWCRKAKKIIERYALEQEMRVELQCFTCEEKLNQYRGEPFDVLFLDIALDTAGDANENGIALASRINQRWKNCQIVYLTNYLFYATEVYQTMHVFFILKEQFEQRVGEIFEKVQHQIEQKSKRLLFLLIGGTALVLSPEEILYFERKGRITKIVTIHGVYEIRDKLDEVMKRLSKLDFIRCHNSYIVYFPAVREMTKGMFILNNGVEILISRSHAKEVRNAFMNWAMMQLS